MLLIPAITTAVLLVISPPAAGFSILHTSVSCDRHNFGFIVHVDEPFGGLIYSAAVFPNCIYANGSVRPSTHYDIKIPLDACGTRLNDDSNFENSVVVQARRHASADDRKFLLTCIKSFDNSPISSSSSSQSASSRNAPMKSTFGSDNAVDLQRDDFPSSSFSADSHRHVTLSFGGVTVSPSATTTELVDARGAKNVQYTVAVLDGHGPAAERVARALHIGDPIAYVVEVWSSAGARLGKCWATDGQSELQLADEKGCSVQTAGEVWTNFLVTKREQRTRFESRIKAWAFPTSNEVNIFCNLHMCEPSRPCENVDCDNPRQRRAKKHIITSRDVEDRGHGFAETTLYTSFRVRRDGGQIPPSLPITPRLSPDILRLAAPEKGGGASGGGEQQTILGLPLRAVQQEPTVFLPTRSGDSPTWLGRAAEVLTTSNTDRNPIAAPEDDLLLVPNDGLPFSSEPTKTTPKFGHPSASNSENSPKKGPPTTWLLAGLGSAGILVIAILIIRWVRLGGDERLVDNSLPPPLNSQNLGQISRDEMMPTTGQSADVALGPPNLHGGRYKNSDQPQKASTIA